MTTALVCAKCGAPLPLQAAGQQFVSCAYCNATLRVDAAGASLAQDAGALSSTPLEKLLDEAVERRKRFMLALAEHLKANVKPYDALCSAARDHLGTLGQSDGIARVTLALAADFDAKNGTKCTQEATALSRLAEAYMKACQELAHKPRTEMNLPFLTANEEGPKHFQLEVTPAVFAALVTREPVQPAAERPPSPEQEPPKKKGWWPFG